MAPAHSGGRPKRSCTTKGRQRPAGDCALAASTSHVDPPLCIRSDGRFEPGVVYVAHKADSRECGGNTDGRIVFTLSAGELPDAAVAARLRCVYALAEPSAGAQRTCRRAGRLGRQKAEPAAGAARGCSVEDAACDGGGEAAESVQSLAGALASSMKRADGRTVWYGVPHSRRTVVVQRVGAGDEDDRSKAASVLRPAGKRGAGYLRCKKCRRFKMRRLHGKALRAVGPTEAEHEAACAGTPLVQVAAWDVERLWLAACRQHNMQPVDAWHWLASAHAGLLQRVAAGYGICDARAVAETLCAPAAMKHRAFYRRLTSDGRPARSYAGREKHCDSHPTSNRPKRYKKNGRVAPAGPLLSPLNNRPLGSFADGCFSCDIVDDCGDTDVSVD